MINLMDDFMAQIHQEEGDAFPYEKARIISELELSMTPADLANKRFFPSWLHVLAPKNALQNRGGDGDDWQGQAAAVTKAVEKVLGRQNQRLDLFAKHLDETFQASLSYHGVS